MIKVNRQHGIIAGICLLGFIIYFYFSPAENRWFPQCPFHLITGFKCAGCGSQRAIHALLHFDIYSAMQYNALLVCSLPFIILYSYAEMVRTKNPNFYIRIHKPIILILYLIIILVWFVGRNIWGY